MQGGAGRVQYRKQSYQSVGMTGVRLMHRGLRCLAFALAVFVGFRVNVGSNWISYVRLCNQSRSLLKRCLIAGLVAFALGILAGCATGKVPGDSQYCLEDRPSGYFKESIQSAKYSYGPFKSRAAKGTSAVCGLDKFYALNITWQTKAGKFYEVTADVTVLMEDFDRKNKVVHSMISGYSWPHLILSIENNRLDLIYETTEEYDNGPAPKGGRYVGQRKNQYPIHSITAVPKQP